MARPGSTTIPVGGRFGSLTVVADMGTRGQGKRYVSVLCACGVSKEAPLYELRKGLIVSCGCGKKHHNLKHGKRKVGSQDPTYVSWYSALGRCTNLCNPGWPHYGGRGITICDRWKDFRLFLEDMGTRPDGTSLERKDNSKGYDPENCVWATQSEQMWNTRRTVKVLLQGEVLNIRQLAERSGLPEALIRQRLKTGWAPERAISTPKGS